MMNSGLKDLGEFGLIDLIKQDTIQDPSSVIAGIGDDAAIVLPTPRQLQLLTTDMLVESVHFDLKTTTPWQLGYKAVAVNLSDIAAMGGNPKQALVSLAIPKTTPADFVVDLYKGMKEICREFGVNIVGGDTVSTPQTLTINVAVLGEVEPGGIVRRSGAGMGDIVAVTGTLGNSGAGLDLLLAGDWEEHDFAWPLVTAHLTPRPQVKAGQLLGGMGVSSLNDVSDGLASEAHEISLASEVGMHIFADKIPLAGELKAAAALLHTEALHYALYGGEDYQLLFTAEPSRWGQLAEMDIGVEVTAIGKVTRKEEGVKLVMPDGRILPLEPKGYNHFR
ncbi:hypothetical protein P22_2379 [Propionispora sp. 2/2-37]|uniref:thiamine-phosphate kinase n=1 Tax=Propionispora sp. 2/2-37 TaxID=1677858 RepID=UPI0006BB9882|nr:thiamine-phosphate kinase [Propionispora sp. 2/2-37]CUH96289.1 hypothetical protein P22_2379 [Propionispora sp. 2/2-37]